MSSVAERDRAVVVGITRYPSLTNLEGSENDAVAFHTWVTSPDGGAVPATQAALILSSDYPGGNEPTRSAIEARLNRLIELAYESQEHGTGFRAGRRLYLYFSGHGCAPSFDETALLMANASRYVVYHLTGKPVADWFYLSRAFDEVVLVMDCCRERFGKVHAYFPPWPERTQADAVGRGRRFYAHATKWSKKAKEKVYPPGSGQTRGVFSVAILAGLTGAAYDAVTQRRDPTTGLVIADVTANSLRNYLINHTSELFTASELADDEVGADPDVLVDDDPAGPLVLATVPVPSYAVRFRVPPAAADGTLEITALRPDGTMPVVASVPLTSLEVVVRLPRDNFVARLTSATRPVLRLFAVNAAPGVTNVIDLA